MSLLRDRTPTAGEDIGRYPAALRLFHWAVALLLAAQYTVAWTMPHIGRGTLPIGLVAWHLFFGTTILAVMILRFVWRLRSTIPRAPERLPRTMQIASWLTHYALYFAVFLVAILGWANSSSRGWSLKFLGFIPLPSIMAEGSSLGHRLGDVHHTLANALLYLIGFHVAAAIYHLLVLRDRTHRRMI